MEGYQSLEAAILALGDLRPGRALHEEGEGVSGPSSRMAPEGPGCGGTA